jgi:hypothetical protein
MKQRGGWRNYALTSAPRRTANLFSLAALAFKNHTVKVKISHSRCKNRLECTRFRSSHSVITPQAISS